VLGLRAMFFLLSGIIDKFYLLQKGLSIILFFIGAKMLLEIFDVKVDVTLSFSVIILTLTLSIIFSVVIPKKEKAEEGLS
jgi:tellurite resistance protein TerC